MCAVYVMRRGKTAATTLLHELVRGLLELTLCFMFPHGKRKDVTRALRSAMLLTVNKNQRWTDQLQDTPISVINFIFQFKIIARSTMIHCFLFPQQVPNR